MARKKIVAGNWKMNMTPSQAVKLVEELKRLLYRSLRFKCPSNIRKLHIANMPC